MDAYYQLLESIIRSQEKIIGPLAIEQANQVEGLTVDLELNHFTVTGNRAEVINHLIQQYQLLFGQTSVEVCKEAARDIITHVKPEEVPLLLR